MEAEGSKGNISMQTLNSAEYDNKGFENEESDEKRVAQHQNGTRASKDGSEIVLEERERDTWTNKREFLLSCIAMSVGLGNVWRFPFTAYENGGGAFLIPYILVVFLIGKPIYFLELSIGQFTSYGQVKCWKMAPILKGIGYGSMFATICSLSYYVYIMALTIFYFIISFRTTLPWTICKREWIQISNKTDLCDDPSNSVTYPDYYFYQEVIKEKENIDDGIGTPEWRLTLCLLAAWVIIFFIIIRGVKSSGKAAYFNAMFPYVVLFIFLIRGATLPGAWRGIKYFLEPKWGELLKAKVWFAAVGQCFFSLSAGFGPIIMYSSYNNFKQNIYKSAMIVSFMDLFTSLLSGITIFAVLGYLAEEIGAEDIDFVQSGSGLAFISYPLAISKFNWAPQFFSVLFFMMMFTLGVGSSTSDAAAIVTIFCDQFPKYKRWIVTVFVCTGGFLVGLVYVTPGGQWVLTIVDAFGANFTVYLMCMLECVAVSWIYGLDTFCKDLEFMLEIKISWFWRFCWGYFMPVILFALLIYSLISDTAITYKEMDYPTAGVVAGWLLAVVGIGMIPIWGIRTILSREGNTFFEKFRQALKPTSKWGPKNSQDRKDWIAFKEKLP